MTLTGRCLCGAVRFSADASPAFQVKCHCTDCRRTSGGGHSAMMGFAQSAVTVTGEVALYQSRADSGREVTRAFCPVCGTAVWSANAAMADMIFLRASTLDDPNVFTPQMSIFTARAPVWDLVSAGIPAFAESPQGAGAQP